VDALRASIPGKYSRQARNRSVSADKTPACYGMSSDVALSQARSLRAASLPAIAAIRRTSLERSRLWRRA